MESIKEKLHKGNEKIKNINVNKIKDLGKVNKKKTEKL